MGTYYYYCNLDRREYFTVGLGGQAIKRVGVGRNRAARALGLLLLPGGRWAGQRVCVLGDDAPLPEVLRADPPIADFDTAFDWLAAHCRDVRALALRALLRVDGQELCKALATDDALLTELAFFADHGDPECGTFLTVTFGAGWRTQVKARVDYSGVTGSILSRALPVPEE